MIDNIAISLLRSPDLEVSVVFHSDVPASLNKRIS